MAADLLPCPFCGGEAAKMVEIGFAEGGPIFYGDCRQRHCGACMESSDTFAEAVTRWNRRVAPPNLIPLSDELSDHLRKRAEEALAAAFTAPSAPSAPSAPAAVTAVTEAARALVTATTGRLPADSSDSVSIEAIHVRRLAAALAAAASAERGE